MSRNKKKLKFILSLIGLSLYIVCIFLADYFSYNLLIQDIFIITGSILFVVFALVAIITYRDMKTYLNFRGNFSLKVLSEDKLVEQVLKYIEKNDYKKAQRFKRADVYIKEQNRIINIIAFLVDKEAETDIFYSLYNKCADLEEKKKNKKYNVVIISCGAKRKRKREVFSYGGNISKLGITILDFNFEDNKVYLDTGMVSYNQSLRQLVMETFQGMILFD